MLGHQTRSRGVGRVASELIIPYVDHELTMAIDEAAASDGCAVVVGEM